jgi:hypothetical protein
MKYAKHVFLTLFLLITNVAHAETIPRFQGLWVSPEILDDPSRRYVDERGNSSLCPWRSKAETGDLESQFKLAKFYYQGAGGAPDKKQAAAWFTTAAERGHVGSQSFLAFMYLTGEGVSKSPDAAILWYERAAKAGDLSAAQNLAFHFKQGQMLPRDLVRSLQWCQYFVDRQKKEDVPMSFKNGCERYVNDN